tara:strand:+ start:767 stop:1456 length:690 start_codon:yes stop_codon:yes gene_type:complete
MKIYLDSGSLIDISFFAKKNFVSGFTTNPSLLKKSNIKNYKEFVYKCKNIVKSKSISFEVTADSYKKILEQANWLKKNAKKCYIKVPIVNSEGLSNIKIIKKLQEIGCKLNITAVFTENQIDTIFKNINKQRYTIISIFAGRIADTGKSPNKIIKLALNKSRKSKKINILWASAREIYNFYEAKKLGCDIITLDKSLISKLKLRNKNLKKYSKETSKQFFKDGKKIKFI